MNAKSDLREPHLLLLRKCLDAAAETLGPDEAIIRVHAGRIRPGRQIFHEYKFDIATPNVSLSSPPRNRRCLFVEINQDIPDSAQVVHSPWEPYDLPYDK